MGNPTQAARLCEQVLEQGPGCAWVLRRDLIFHVVFGNCLPLFGKAAGELAGSRIAEALPPGSLEAWEQRAERVFRGETLVWRERTASSRLFFITHFPVGGGNGEAALAGGTALDVTDLFSVEQELRNTALRVLKGQELERTRLARFLHDEVGQCLSAAGLQLALLRMDLERVVPDIPARTAEVQQVLEGVMERVREFSYELNPSMVERAGLYSALDRLVGRVRREFHGTLRLMADSTLRLETPIANALYKIAEEAVENAIRHSGGDLVEVLLKSTRHGPILEVRDNGAGFDASEVNGGRRGLGLLIMEHCAAEANVELEVSSIRGRGAVIRAIAGCTPAAAGR